MNRLTALATVALLVGMAVPAASHADRGQDPYAPLDHMCVGVPDFVEQEPNGASTIGFTREGQDARLYIHLPPHGQPEGQDPETGAGILWLESNGFHGLQKADYVCASEAHKAESHSDLVLL